MDRRRGPALGVCPRLGTRRGCRRQMTKMKGTEKMGKGEHPGDEALPSFISPEERKK